MFIFYETLLVYFLIYILLFKFNIIIRICSSSSFYELSSEALRLFTNLPSIPKVSNSCPQAPATYLSIKMTSNVSQRAVKDRCSLNNSIIYVATKFT